ncbi:integrin alpha-6-like [Cyprinodon tularosa]|uniref:integrin alpha-6-like n=1 Tax=Cyprinodon tularosa TaxID=77115 RepID=UPI0018E279B5|nr:integrin alpha-6-like [Cyprinodon tularosa]
MEGHTSSGLWLLTLLLGCGQLIAFNLDTENVLRRDGEKGSLFGFSVAMHWQTQPQNKKMVLVGAPQAKAIGKQKSKVTGGIYKCELDSDKCNRIIFDDNEDLKTESKENQWMGVTVSSQGPGGKVLTCAHRYQQRVPNSESRTIDGRCYVLSQDLTLTSDEEDGGNWRFCSGRDYLKFGSCQQGLSARFDKDYHYFIFGAPGAYDWKGLVRLEQKNITFFTLPIPIFNDGPFETGDERKLDDKQVPTPDNSYLGFSLDTGKLLTASGELTVVAGAPRAFYSGAVVLLKKGGPDTRSMEPEHILKGEGLASSFGYDLTVLDFNGDGWEDIVVGAPQFFKKESDIGGAVYIYINKAGNWKEAKPTRIDGTADSMFGLAVEFLGDLNQDGYHDFAVGAPYEDDGAGKVYIYHGSARTKPTNKHTQVLSGKSFGARQFGYSLAGNMDLDWNFYPDMVVGSLSDSIFTFKTRPVVSIQKEVTFSPSKINLSEKNCGNAFCLEVKACFTYAAHPTANSPSLKIKYNLEVDAERKKNNLEPRGKFTVTPDPENTHKSIGILTMKAKGKQQCVTEKLMIEEGIKDKLLAIPIDVLVNIDGNANRKRRQTQASQLTPILDAKDVKTTRTEVEFLKEGCGNDGVCNSNLKLEYRYGYTTLDEDIFTPVNMDKGVPTISLSTSKSVALEVTVTNKDGEDAYEAFVIGYFPRAMTYSVYRAPINSQVRCEGNTNGSKADCEVGNPFKRNTKTTFYIILGTTDQFYNTTEFNIELHLKTMSEQPDLMSVNAKAKVAIELQLSLSGQIEPSQVSFSEEPKEVTDSKTESDIGSAITYRFTIINRGKRLKDIGTATLQINWPKMTEENNDLLYLMEISSNELKQIKCTPTGEINPLKKKPDNRNRRATNEGGYGTLSRLIGNNKKIKTLSCDAGTKCVTLKCPLLGLDYKATITLKSRLWNTTFIKEFSDANYVEVLVMASLHVDSTKITMQKDPETQVRLMVFPERRTAQFGSGVAWWIILLSILLLLLLLALLAFLLWKCGLFEKKKDGPSDKEKLTTNA